MLYTQDIVEEMNLLVKFPIHSNMEGVKVHSDANPALVSAAQRLYAKGLVTQLDGGYLTHTGHQVAENAKIALRILTGKTAE